MARFTTVILLFLVLCIPASAKPVWPDCDVVAGKKGAPTVRIEGAPHVPILFAANNQAGPNDILLKELRLAAEAGIRLFSFTLMLDWHMTAEEAERTVEQFCAAHPEGYVYLRIWLGPNQDWLDAHPNDCITKADGTRLPYASPSSTVWREAAAARLEQRIREILEGPHAHQFIGVMPTYLQNGEWFYPDAEDFMDYSPANLQAFRQWLKKIYRRKKTLQMAWNNPEITFDFAQFPAPESRDTGDWGPFRDPAIHQAAIDMQRFQSELIADTIAYFVRIIKKTTQNRSLTGAFYGYTMELNHNSPRALAHRGHLALETLLACDDLDIIHAPFSYLQRAPGQPGHLHLPIDSVALHGKLVLLEDDTRTHLSPPNTPGRTASLDETIAVTQRNAATALTHRAGFWFFDRLANGAWNDKVFWSSTVLLRRMAAELRTCPPFEPEVAFIVSESAVHYLQAATHPVLLQSLGLWRSELDRTGTPVGYYLQSDLPQLPESVKVIILANPYHLNKGARRAIEKRLHAGATVIWTYAPDLIGPAGIDYTRLSAITGLPIEVKADNTPMTIVSELTGGVTHIDATSWRPRFIVGEEHGGDVVARYQATGEISAAAIPRGAGVSLYTATPRLSTELLREIFHRAGVHFYQFPPGMTGVVGPYLIVHTEGGLTDETIDDIIADMRGPRVHSFEWPTPCQSVTRVIPHRPWPYALKDGRTWVDTLPGCATAIYQCK